MKQFLGFSSYSNQTTLARHKLSKPFGRTCFSSNPSMNNSKSKEQKSKEDLCASNRIIKANIKFPSGSTNLSTTDILSTLPKNEISPKVYENLIQKLFSYMKKTLSLDTYEDIKNKFFDELNKEITIHSSSNSNSMSNITKNLKLSYETNLEDDFSPHNKKISPKERKNGNNCSKMKSYCNKTNISNITSANKNSFNKEFSLRNKTNTKKTYLHNLNKHSLYSLTKKKPIISSTANNSKSNSLEHLPLSTKQSRPNSKKSNGNRNISKHKNHTTNLSINGSNGHLSLNQKLFNKISNKINNNIKNNINININKTIIQSKSKNTRNYNLGRTTTNSVKKNKTNTKILSSKNKETKEESENNNYHNENRETITNIVNETGEFNGSDAKNSEQLREIKSSLDDNLKVMFNFSYECFLNKESESEGRRSFEDVNYITNMNNKNNNNIYTKNLQKNSSMQITTKHNFKY